MGRLGFEDEDKDRSDDEVGVDVGGEDEVGEEDEDGVRFERGDVRVWKRVRILVRVMWRVVLCSGDCVEGSREEELRGVDEGRLVGGKDGNVELRF